MDKYFLSTDNIKSVSNQVFQGLNINNSISIDEKQNIVRKIITVMQTIYQNMDKSKINQRNINKAIEIFNTKSIKSSINQLGNLQSNRDIPPRPNYNPRQDQPYMTNNTPITFQRDAEIYGNRNVVLNNRQSESYKQPNVNRQQAINQEYNNRQFTPLQQDTQYADSLQREQYMNGLNNKADRPIDDRLKDLQSQRNFEIPNMNQRPPDINFGLDWEGKNKKQPNNQNYNSSYNQNYNPSPNQNSNQNYNQPKNNNQNNQNFDFSSQLDSQNLEMNQQKSLTGFNDGLNGFGMNPNVGDLNSLDNYNLGITEIPPDDNLSFEQRLKNIESERSSFDPTGSQQVPQQQMPQQQMPQQRRVSFADDQPQMQQQMQQRNMQQQMAQPPMQQPQMQQRNMQQQQIQQRGMQQQQMQQRGMQQQMQQQQMQQRNLEQKNPNVFFLNNNTNQDNSGNTINTDDNVNMVETNNELLLKLNEYYGKLEELANILVERDTEIDSLKNKINDLESNQNNANEDSQRMIKQLQDTILSNRESYDNTMKGMNEELNNKKDQIQNLSSLLNEKDEIIKNLENKRNEELEEKQKLIQDKLDELLEIQNEIEDRAKTHQQKEKYLLGKENEVKELIVQNNLNLNKPENLIINYSRVNYNNNNYEYKLDRPRNIEQIQLISYKANKINNINDSNHLLDLNVYIENMNGELVSDSENEEQNYKDITVSIVEGSYTLQSLIDTFNDNLKNYNITFTLVNNHIRIQSNKKFSLHKKDNSILTMLGFDKDSYTDLNEYTSENENLVELSQLYSFKINNICLGNILLGITKDNQLINNSNHYIDIHSDKIKFTVEDHNGSQILLRKPYEFNFIIKEKNNDTIIENFIKFSNAQIS